MIFTAVHAAVQTNPRLFKYVSQGAVQRVSLAGTFNNWNKDATPMRVGPDGRTWTTTIDLPYGQVQYKFVLNGSDWIVDPLAPSVSDGNGHFNSKIFIEPPDYAVKASPSDGVTAASALLHEPAEPQLNYDRGELQFKFRARPDDLAEVDLVANGKKVPMRETARDELFASYVAKLPWNRNTDISYFFELHDGPKIGYYGTDGFKTSSFRPFKLSAKTYQPFSTPNWVEGAVVYQIFPDRFANGDTRNDPKDVQPFDAKPTYSNRFGGDVAGVKQHLSYLTSLGIRAVYFTPVFQSPSNHRYDTTDYRKIDPEFGANEEFDALVREMRASHIYTILDFAFNHTATNFFAFQDIRDKGASSAYLNWYFIKSFPVVVKENPPYVAWFNYPSMPKLNAVNPATEKYILDTFDLWRKNAGIEGARLDVANEVDPKLWKDFRAHVKSEDPNFWIVGEEWGDANPWLHGDQWDSTMGYQFRDACLGYFANKATTASEFMNRLNTIYASYPSQVARNLMNLLGTHDTPRFLTLCNGDVSSLEMAATVQLTWPGTPSIYYGDEIGMVGGADPDNRRGMVWSLANDSNPILQFYRKLIAARNHSQALQSGDPMTLKIDDASKSFAYARVAKKDSVIVAVNASEMPRQISLVLPETASFASLKAGAWDIISGKQFAPSNTISLILPPHGEAVLLPGGKADLTLPPLTASSVTRPILSGHRSPTFSQGAI